MICTECGNAGHQALDLYRVGALAYLYRARRYLTLPISAFPASTAPPISIGWRLTRARSELRQLRQNVTRHVRKRQWHELRQTFNGWLAEPYHWPNGLGKCGRGWTRRSALRSLARRLDRSGLGNTYPGITLHIRIREKKASL